MVTLKRYFDPNLYYHVYNCGVEKRKILLSPRDYERFIDATSFYLHDQKTGYAQLQSLKPTAREVYWNLHPTGVETLRARILAWVLMPNHFHFLIKPVRPEGMIQFISDISNSHARYFNVKNERLGKLFQGAFKAKEIKSEASLLQVSRYIHLNSTASSKTAGKGGVAKPEDYPYSSYREWLEPWRAFLVDKGELQSWLEYAGGSDEYRSFVEAKIGKDLASGIEDLILEEP